MARSEVGALFHGASFDRRKHPVRPGLMTVGVQSLPKYTPETFKPLEPDILPQIPIKRALSFSLLQTAAHELKHSLVAYENAVPISSISVIPSGNTLGVTTLGRIPSISVLQAIAAAGSLHTPFGEGSGYGSDLMKAQILSYSSDSLSVSSALHHAHNATAKYSSELQKKAAEIIRHVVK